MFSPESSISSTFQNTSYLLLNPGFNSKEERLFQKVQRVHGSLERWSGTATCTNITIELFYISETEEAEDQEVRAKLMCTALNFPTQLINLQKIDLFN